MAQGPESHTSTCLLHMLVHDPTNEQGWRAFVDRYGPKIFFWCRKWGLQEADAEDVTQEVLVKMAQKLRLFDPTRGKFRAWLKTVTQHALDDYMNSQRRGVVGSGATRELELLSTLEARDDVLRQLEAEFDLELLEEAQARVRLRVEARTWQAFHLLAVEQLSGAEAAQRTGMKVASVYVARERVQKMLQQEIQRLQGFGRAENHS